MANDTETMKSSPAATLAVAAPGVGDPRGWVCLAVAVLFAAIFFPAHGFNPSCFDDCYGYTVLMGMWPFSPDFWETARDMFRGFAVPLLYSLFGEYSAGSARAIVYFQAFASFVAWLSLGFAVARLWGGRRIAPWVFAVVASGMFSRGYLRFDDRLLSDSLALSLLVGWFALALNPEPLASYFQRRLGRYWAWPFLGAFAVLTALAAGARDTNVFILVFGMPILFVVAGQCGAPLFGVGPRRLAAMMAAVVVIVAVVQLQAAAARNALNMANVVAGVVLGHGERSAYFVERGLPASVAAIERPWAANGATGLRAITDDSKLVVLGGFRTTRDQVRKRAADFLASRARVVYASYLVTHPGYVAGNIAESWDVMFDQRYEEGAGAAATFSAFEFSKRLSALDFLGVRTLVAFALALLVASLVALPESRRDPLLAIGALLGLAGFANAVIAFHGDLWELSEMARHGWIGGTFLRLGAVILLLRVTWLLYRRGPGGRRP